MHLLKIAPWQDQEMEIFYEEVDQLMRITKKHEINMVLGDLNTKVEEEKFRELWGNTAWENAMTDVTDIFSFAKKKTSSD